MSSKSAQKILLIKICCIITAFFVCGMINAQSKTYGQSWNELKFNRTINKKWSGELNLGSSYSSTESSSNIFQSNIQQSVAVWAHYYLTPRWKLSTSAAYFNNKDVPEIGQYESPEWRFALQGIYYFHKTGYTLSTRMRMELRHMKNGNNDYEDVLRYRQQIKYQQPINSKALRKGVIYAVAFDELFFKSGAKVTGESFFDRNRLNVGGGYLITDDFQVELTYANEYLPRNGGNKIINAASLIITFNNFFENISKKLTPKKQTEAIED
ncbi:DUF2490 domain-containing protein [Flavobacterium saccharophilum]|uniref:DUF2490 domain-containing protein n=1 Tax=Flavobacterium saccharophilum TaxID=29534 RepID=A0A1M7KEY1_9FLAO|nr:DUF2490 domain-containing protein [Flavobacterium saccharophilum]SHM63601.1 Protein of unknown function [Flavobacterium saccharophilum]